MASYYTAAKTPIIIMSFGNCVYSAESRMHYIVYLFVRLVEEILRHCIMHFFVIVCEWESEMSCL